MIYHALNCQQKEKRFFLLFEVFNFPLSQYLNMKSNENVKGIVVVLDSFACVKLRARTDIF